MSRNGNENKTKKIRAYGKRQQHVWVMVAVCQSPFSKKKDNPCTYNIYDIHSSSIIKTKYLYKQQQKLTNTYDKD